MNKNIKPFIYTTLLFIFYLVIYYFQKKIIGNDATIWINYGVQIFHGNLQDFAFNAAAPDFSPLVYTPGYPFFIGLFNLVINNPVFSAYLVSMLAGALLALTMFYLGKELYNEKVGYIALFLGGLYSPLVGFAVSTFVRSTAMLFLTLSVYFLIKALKTKKELYSILTGVFITISVLTRFEFILYAILLGGIYLFHLWNKNLSIASFIKFMVAASFIYCLYAIPLYQNSGYLLISPYIGNQVFGTDIPQKPNFNMEEYEEAGLSMKTVLFNNNTAASLSLKMQKKVKVSKEDYERFGDTPVREKSGSLASIISPYRDLLFSILPQLLPFHIIGFFLFGLIFFHRKKIPYQSILYMIFLSTLIIFPLIGTRVHRYYMQLLPFIALIAAFGIYYIAELAQRFTGRKVMFYVPIILVLGVYFGNDIQNVRTHYTKNEQMWLKAAEYLRTTASSDDIVMARKNYAAFYSGLKMAWLPDEQNLDDVLEYANHIQADYLILEDETTLKMMPQYTFLMTGEIPQKYQSQLEITAEYNKGTPYHLRIIKLKKGFIVTQDS